VSAWDELDQRVIDTAVTQWRTRFYACVKAKDDYFEHTLPSLALINMHMLRFCVFDTLLCSLQIAFCFNEVPDVR